MKINRLILTLALVGTALVSIGCSSGGGDSASPPVDNSDATGVWEGTFTESGVGTFSLIGLVEGNQMRLISTDAGGMLVGTILVSGTNFTGTTTNFEIGGTVYSTANLTGTVTTKSSLSGTFVSSTGATGSFSLKYNPVTDKGSSLAITDGNWTDSTATAVISIDSTGLVTGADASGCVYLGATSIIDPAVNIYKLSLGVSSCGAYNGTYAGYVVITDDITTNDTLVYVANNSNFVVVSYLTRT